TATVSYDGASNTATLTPSTPLASGTTYTAKLNTTVQGGNGAALASAYTWSFSTTAAVTPTVVTTSPPAGATEIGLRPTISATFSTSMDPATITTSSFTLTAPNGSALAASV